MTHQYWVNLLTPLPYVEQTRLNGTLEQCLAFIRDMNLYAWDLCCQGTGIGIAEFEGSKEVMEAKNAQI